MQHHMRSVKRSPQAEAAGERSQVDSDMILYMLSRMTSYFNSMVDPFTNRFYYRCLPESPVLPESRRRLHGHSPIRDLGAAWDTANLLSFWERRKAHKAMKALLSTALVTTVNAYIGPTWLTFDDSPWCVAIPSNFLREPSTIAHSAFLVLSSLGARRLSLTDSSSNVPIDSLVRGILYMQSDNGAFAIHFGYDDIFQGIEFYPGEAMLALLDAYETSADTPDILSPSARMEIVPAVQRAFLFYSDYYRHGNVDWRYTSFFGNWQVQCFAKLFDALRQEEKKQTPEVAVISSEEKKSKHQSSVTAAAVADYVLELCDSIVASGPWQLLREGDYMNLSTVEIACGLEALAEGCRLALELHSESVSSNASGKVTEYWPFVESAIKFLAAVQNKVPEGGIGSGGLGYGLLVSEQRLDVTGHAVNALIKVYEVQNTLLPQASSRPVSLA